MSRHAFKVNTTHAHTLTREQFTNLFGSVYTQGNLLFTPDGNTLLSPVGNKVSVFELRE